MDGRDRGGIMAFAVEGGAQEPTPPPPEQPAIPEHGFYLGVKAGEPFPGDEARRITAQAFGSAAEVAEQVVVWDGRPSLESCDVGSTTLGGRANPRTERLCVTVRPASGGQDESWDVATQGESWTGMSSRALAGGDLVMMASIYQHDPTFSVTGPSPSAPASAGRRRRPARGWSSSTAATACSRTWRAPT